MRIDGTTGLSEYTECTCEKTSHSIALTSRNEWISQSVSTMESPKLIPSPYQTRESRTLDSASAEGATIHLVPRKAVLLPAVDASGSSKQHERIILIA